MMHRAQKQGEVELKSELDGEPARTVRRGALLSKADRNVLSQRSGALGHEQKASAVDISKKMDVGQVFVMIVRECVRHFRLNEALIVEQRDPAALHQARVAMRRLRTAFTLFAPAIRKGSLKPLRKELRAFVASFGDARNLDVFLATHGRDLKAGDRRKVMAARAKAYDRVIEKLEAQSSRELLLNPSNGPLPVTGESAPRRLLSKSLRRGGWMPPGERSGEITGDSAISKSSTFISSGSASRSCAMPSTS